MVEMPVIDSEKCRGCGTCVSICACGALVLVGKIVTIIEVEDCHWCTLCEAVCPNGASRQPALEPVQVLALMDAALAE